MGRFVQRTAQQRWLGHALDHLSGGVVASAFGRRADKVFVAWQKLLPPFGLEPFSTEGAGVYDRPLPAAAHPVGKGTPHQSERHPLPVRTRLKRFARKTLCFSTSAFRHDPVIGLCVNRYEFGTPI
jgi:insertion element IS1 protein InsB